MKRFFEQNAPALSHIHFEFNWIDTKMNKLNQTKPYHNIPNHTNPKFIRILKHAQQYLCSKGNCWNYWWKFFEPAIKQLNDIFFTYYLKQFCKMGTLHAVLFSIGSIERYAFVPVQLTVLSYHFELCEHFNDITAELFQLYAIELFN